MTARKIEIFSAGCPLCREAIALVNSIAPPSSEVEVLDMHQGAVASRAKQLGVCSVPAVAIDGKLAAGCGGQGIDEVSLREAVADNVQRSPVIPSIAAHLRHFVGNRRQAPRYPSQREVHLTALVSQLSEGSMSLTGVTHDISETGLALVLPSHRIGEHDVIIVGYKLRILLALPTKTINMHATTVYCKLLDEQGPEKGCIVGVRIVGISPSDEAHYMEYLHTLG